ncbi:MAG: helix-turn-helix transcriptional regulator [Clostridia bacterium]|nr:helix-turn-helix transcriptional regulator [Clostridia bacterium]
MDVIKRIDDLRKDRGWSIYKLAEESALTQSTVSNMFNRGTVPTIFTLQQICDAFGITLSEFFAETVTLSNQDEVMLLSQYRRLKAPDQQVVRKLTQFMADRAYAL